MTDTNVLKLSQPATFSDPLTEVLRSGARSLLAQAVGAEVAGFLASLATSSASALALIKRQLYELDGRSFEDGIRLGADVNAVARETPDFRDAVTAFLKK